MTLMTSYVGVIFMKTLKLALGYVFYLLVNINYATDCHEIFSDVWCIIVLRVLTK